MRYKQPYAMDKAVMRWTKGICGEQGCYVVDKRVKLWSKGLCGAPYFINFMNFEAFTLYYLKKIGIFIEFVGQCKLKHRNWAQIFVLLFTNVQDL